MPNPNSYTGRDNDRVSGPDDMLLAAFGTFHLRIYENI